MNINVNMKQKSIQIIYVYYIVLLKQKDLFESELYIHLSYIVKARAFKFAY